MLHSVPCTLTYPLKFSRTGIGSGCDILVWLRGNLGKKDTSERYEDLVVNKEPH